MDLSRVPSTHVTTLQLDSNGAMLALGLDIGVIAIYNFESIRQGSCPLVPIASQAT